jgi:hypothetical protein
MVTAPGASHDADMTTIDMQVPARGGPVLDEHPLRSAPLATPSTRELHGHASGLLAAAAGLRAAARTRDETLACGPTLACLECALDALAHAVRELGAGAARAVPRDGASIDARLAVSEIDHRFAELAEALAGCRVLCAQAQAAVRARPAWDDT